MKRIVIIVVLLCAAPLSARTLQFVGDQPSNHRQLERLAERLPADSAIKAIQSSLNDDGYLAARVDTSDDRLLAYTGSRYYLERVIVEDSTAETLSLPVSPFTAQYTSEQVRRILTPLENSGYYFASAVARAVVIHGTLADLRLRVTRGPLVRGHTYVFGGLEKSPPSQLERYLPVIKDQPITPGLIEQVESAATRIPFVVFVPSVEVRPREGYTSADLRLSFIERRQFRIQGIAGYVPSTTSGLLWTLDARFQNLFGGGREAFVKSERRERGRNLLDVGYSQPLFFAGVGDIGGRVSTRDYRDDFYEFAIQSHYNIEFTPTFRVGVVAGWRNVEPNNDLSPYNAFSAGLELEAANHRNEHQLPYFGLSWSVNYSFRRYKEDTLTVTPHAAALNETRTTLKLSSTLPISGALAGHLGATYMGYETPETLPPISELYLLGGPGTIRGFRNDRFLAQRAAIAVVEPRLRFTDGYLYLFADGAYINVPEVDASGLVRTNESFHAGYGVGFNIRNAARAVDISLGWNREVTFDQPRLSVQFISDI